MEFIKQQTTETIEINSKFPEKTLNAEWMSYDKNVHKVVVPVKTQSGISFEMGEIEEVLVYLNFSKGSYGPFEGKAEDIEQRTVSFAVPEEVRGQTGNVTISIMLKLTNDRQIDLVQFKAVARLSKIDQDTPAIQEFYVPLFEDLVESVTTDFNEDVALAKSKIDQAVKDTIQNVDELQISWEYFVEQNREIIESIDPGGLVLTELIDARKDETGENFGVLKENVNSKLSKKGGKLEPGAELVFPTAENLKFVVMPPGQGLGLIPDSSTPNTARFALMPNINAIDENSTGGLLKLFAVPFKEGDSDYIDMGIYYKNSSAEPGQNGNGAFFINSKSGLEGKYENKNADIIFSFQDGVDKAMRIVYSPTRGVGDRGIVVIGLRKSAYSSFEQVGLEMQKDIFFYPGTGIRFPTDESTATTIFRYNPTSDKVEFIFKGDKICEFSNTGTSISNKINSITSGTNIDVSKGSIFTTTQMISSITNGKEGQQITIVIGDAGGGLTASSDIVLKGGQSFTGKTVRSNITLIRMKTYWLEMARLEL